DWPAPAAKRTSRCPRTSALGSKLDRTDTPKIEESRDGFNRNVALSTGVVPAARDVPCPTRGVCVMAVSRGFRGRRRDDIDASRVPPGQYVTADFPVLSAGPTPPTPLARGD